MTRKHKARCQSCRLHWQRCSICTRHFFAFGQQNVCSEHCSENNFWDWYEKVRLELIEASVANSNV